MQKTSTSWDKTYCGVLRPSDRLIPDTDNPELAMNAYVAEDGEMEVRIHVADRKLEEGNELGVELAFTSFMSKRPRYFHIISLS